MAHRLPITIRVDHFEGPLDLLLYLIQSHELDVSKISIAKITDQYLAYVRLMQELNFDIASDFLLMAATLIQWKSKSLLPAETDPNALLGADGEDALTPEELLRQLQEHQRFLEAGRDLATLTLLGEDVYSRPNTRKPTEKVWKQMDITALALTFQDLLVKERKRTTILKKETVSLAEKIVDFADRMEVGKLTTLSALLRDPNSRPETVVSFLASLELGRLKKMKLFQEKAYEEIYVELLESIKGFDTNLASGFDSIEAAVDKGVAAKHAHDSELTEEQRLARYVTDGTVESAAAGAIPYADRGEVNMESVRELPAGDDAHAGASSDHAAGSDAGTLTTNSAGSDAEDSSSIGSSTEVQLADLGGAENSSSTGNSTEVQLADLSGTEDSAGAGNSSEVQLANLDRAEDRTRAGDSARSGMAERDSKDLASFGELAEPDLGALLSGTHNGPRVHDAEEFTGPTPSPTDGSRNNDTVGRDS